jgi:hypothetical protein
VDTCTIRIQPEVVRIIAGHVAELYFATPGGVVIVYASGDCEGPSLAWLKAALDKRPS